MTSTAGTTSPTSTDGFAGDAAWPAPPGLQSPPTPDPFLHRTAATLAAIQDEIVGALQAFEPDARFVHDDWQRAEGDEATIDSVAAAGSGPTLHGGGRTRVLEGGRAFERAGVNLSLVWGRFSPGFAGQMRLGDGEDFAATGLSLVIHPRSPHVPTVHMNVRRMVRGSTGWYGGGADLTPYLLDDDDARQFHRAMAAVCDRHPIADYDRWKRDCDAYFHNGHRGEARGVGGIFFDWLHGDDEAGFALIRDTARAFLPAYLPLVSRWRHRAWTEAERDWQLHRRGRYVEFNLIHDRGTIFGLKTNGRTESILMSLPPEVRWSYQHDAPPAAAGAALMQALRSPRDWLAGER